MRGASTVLGEVCADLPQKCGKAALSYSTRSSIHPLIPHTGSPIFTGLAGHDRANKEEPLNIERIKEELSKTYAKIERLQNKARELEEQKKQAEDMEYLKIIRKNGISAEELQLLIDISNEEQKQILETREKEQTGNEENP